MTRTINKPNCVNGTGTSKRDDLCTVRLVLDVVLTLVLPCGDGRPSQTVIQRLHDRESKVVDF